MAEHFDVRD